MKMHSLMWPEEQLQAGLSKLAVRLGCPKVSQIQSSRWCVAENPNEWLHEQCDNIELDAQRVAMPFIDLKDKASGLGSCLIKLADEEGRTVYLVVVKTDRRGFDILSPDGTMARLSINQLLDGFIIWLKQKTGGNVEKIVARFEESAGKLSAKLYRKLFTSLLSAYEINQIWTFSPKEKPTIMGQLKAQGAVRYLFGFLFGLLSTQLFFVTSWYILGSNVLSGRAGTDWLPIWLLLLFGFVVSRLYARKKQQELSLLISVMIKRRMLIGMTAMPLEAVKHDGPCHLLTRCYESGQFESATVGLVLGSISAITTLVVALGTLIALQLWGLLFAFLAVSAIAGFVMWQLYKIEILWTKSRLSLTHSLAELMIGQRTRRVQECQSLRHKVEDGKLNSYIELQQQRDGLQVIYGLIPSAWNVMGIGVILLGFATNGSVVNLPLGAAIWLLISAAISQLSSIYLQVIRVMVAWTTVEPLLTHRPPSTQNKSRLTFPSNIDSSRLLEIRDVAYRYPGRDVNVLDGCSLQMGSTDKIILEGQSGCGKSTLISLLTGIRPSTRGSILLAGIEQNMVTKAQWGEKVVMVPQYHENYLFTETLAFNLLLGTEWPAEPEQLKKARTICHELGLTTLLQKMPSELMQVVGEMGWNLSHGEKSRVYIARAILQEPDLIILDESLASLDPENTHRVLACVEKNCKAVIIVAHP